MDAFRTELEARVKLKNIPNTEFNKQTGKFSFADYVWKNPEEQTYPSDTDPEAMAEEDMYEPYSDVFSSVDEVKMERVEDGDAHWAEVTVVLPPSKSRQRQLAHIVSQALQSRGLH